jgi:DNA-binding MarR family transcriptional regulator
MKPKSLGALRDVVTSKLIKTPQLMLLLMANKRGTGWTMTELTATTGLRPSVLTMAKKKLTEDGLLVEHCPQRDRRVTKVYLTESGRDTAKEMWSALRLLVGAEKEIRAGVV